MIQDTSGGNVRGKVRVELSAALGQLRHRVQRDGALPLPHEEGFEGFLRRLLGHETGVGIVGTLVVTAGNPQVVLGLAQPALRCITAWLHRLSCLLGELGG